MGDCVVCAIDRVVVAVSCGVAAGAELLSTVDSMVDCVVGTVSHTDCRAASNSNSVDFKSAKSCVIK